MKNLRLLSASWTTAALVALALAPATGDASCPTRAAWPTADWPTNTAGTTASRAAEIQALEDYAFTLIEPDSSRKGIRTDSVVIVKGGTVVYERYARGYTADKRHISWSVSKSFTSAIVGIAVQRGLMSLSDSVCKSLPLPESNCAITVQQMLEFGSGRRWTEFYEYESNQVSSVLALLYGEGHKDTVAFMAAQPLVDAPGSRYQYSTGEALLLNAVASGALKPTLGEAFPWTVLFDVIGMKSAMWERDQKGNFLGGSHLYATPRDYAKFGFLYLNDGCWDGQRLLPEGWVQSSTTVSPEFHSRVVDAEFIPQGWMWWLNQAVPEQNIPTTPLKDVPGDMYVARGHWGQTISIIPSLDLVIVRTGDDREESKFSLNRFVSLAIAVGR